MENLSGVVDEGAKNEVPGSEGPKTPCANEVAEVEGKDDAEEEEVNACKGLLISADATSPSSCMYSQSIFSRHLC